MTTLERVQIDLEDYTSEASQVYAGKERGSAIREAAKLDVLDDLQDTIVDVHIPKDVFTVTSSFFRALFGPSIERFGAEGFRRRYQFHGWDATLVKEEAIRRVLGSSAVLHDLPDESPS